MEGGATAFNDILTQSGIGRNWFRIVGGKTTSYNQPGGFSILRFEHDGQPLYYREHAGQMTTEQAKAIVPTSLVDAINWADTEPHGKTFAIDQEVVRTIYRTGAHAFFPSSRSEAPFWLNQKAIIEDTFDTTENYAQSLNKPIYVEHGVDAFAQWLLGVLSESKVGVTRVPNPENPDQFSLNVIPSDLPLWLSTSTTLASANEILQAIVADPQAQFFWAGRRQPRKVGVLSGDKVIAAGLDSLSGGQSSLLAIFGTILRYGDAAGLGPQDIPGIVVIDELDAHMHIDLQISAVPKLIAMFPRVQFIMSSHSPFFGLGMEKQFSDEKVRIIDVPTGLTLGAESYAEFDSAMAALMETRAFEQQIGKSLAASEQPVVWVAGETDVPYFRTAAKLLGYPQLVDYFEWIGVPGKSGGGEYTGDDSLKAAVRFLKANSAFTNRTVIAVFDNDANQVDAQFGNVHIIALQKIEEAAVEPGIENLLPGHVFTPDVLYDKEVPSGIVGKPKILPEVRKKLLAEKLCGEDADAANFENFRPYLERITEIVATHAESGGEDGAATSTDGVAGESPPEQPNASS